MNQTCEWGLVIATFLSVLSIVPRHCSSPLCLAIVPRHCVCLTYFLDLKLGEISAVLITHS